MHEKIKIYEDVFEENKKNSIENKKNFKKKKIFVIEVLGAVGSGKTEFIINICLKMKKEGKKVSVIAGDVIGEEDYNKIKKEDIDVINCNTGEKCHLDAKLINKITKKINLDDIDVLFIENVGNLICPTHFELGADKRIVIISITEGDDMIVKHPDIFIHSDEACINKMDLKKYLDIDINKIKKDYNKIVVNKELIEISTKEIDGTDKIYKKIKEWCDEK